MKMGFLIICFWKRGKGCMKWLNVIVFSSQKNMAGSSGSFKESVCLVVVLSDKIQNKQIFSSIKKNYGRK